MAGLLADLIVLLHLGWILFLILGALPGRRWVRMKWLHLLGLAFAGALTAGGWICPLTHLEVWLRRQVVGSAGGYSGTFVGHYAERLVYLDIPREAVLLGVVGVAGYSLWAYWGSGPRRGVEGGGRP